ncbi:MAG: hypothetical protein KIT84_38430 [Labilithrix sp.]|nr:hypothetical protein [Labilithrix sp.]MCW5816938.1 hypothetical protein [Labilithrix sp.]
MKSMSFGRTFTAFAAVATMLATGCLARPVGQQPPTTKVNFTSTVSQQAVDKVDLLIAIDNSASMGDKQEILKDAVPNLIQGLLQPPCVDRETRIPLDSGEKADPSGNKDDNYGCPQPNSEPDFKPVGDMHIGIVSSSLGNFGGDVCPPDRRRTNDGGKLVNINGKDGQKNPLAPLDFLAWYPQNEENEDKKRHPEPEGGGFQTIGAADQIDQGGITPNFQNLVIGVDQTGCGLEAQLESVYRFLIQPDPWDVVRLDNFQQADLGEGIDLDVLKQRADFLRPDSLVAIIMLTDEDDSSADPLAVGGFGYAFMARSFPGSKVNRGTSAQGTTAPRGTSKCETDPAHAECTSCGFASSCDPNSESCQKIKQDVNCTSSPIQGQSGPGFDGFYGPTDDDLNVRFHRMKERFGVDPQYPLKRYVDGFTKFRVPDRTGEHTIREGANGQRLISDYVGTPKCTNPLFASKLPSESGDEICLLGRSTRSPDLIFFAVVGGVPNKLLHFDSSGTPEASERNRISNDDWVKILGRDPANFDYEGIDPHMVQSVAPREDLLGAGSATSARGQNGTDPVHGREWNTAKKDLQYACTFDLTTERSCATGTESCDCTDDQSNPAASPNPPLCATDGSATQIKAKAYPTIREFQVVRALGDQGIIASLCPIQLDPQRKNDPDYGYNPAVAAIIDRLKNALTQQCLPQKLRSAEESATGTGLPVPCLVLVQLSPDSGQSCSSLGLKVPDDAILKVFKEQQKAESGNTSAEGAIDLSTLETCELTQKAVPPGETCANDSTLEWCYVEKAAGTTKNPAGRCPQALIFASGTSILAGARFSLQCIQQFGANEASGDTPQGSSSGGEQQTQSRKH